MLDWLCADQISICHRWVVTPHFSSFFSTLDAHTYDPEYTHTRVQTHADRPLETPVHTPDQSCQDLFRSSLCPSMLHLNPYHLWRCVCVWVGDRYSLSLRDATKCSDISRLYSLSFVIPPVFPAILLSLPLCFPPYLWINASHPIMSTQQLCLRPTFIPRIKRNSALCQKSHWLLLCVTIKTFSCAYLCSINADV